MLFNHIRILALCLMIHTLFLSGCSDTSVAPENDLSYKLLFQGRRTVTDLWHTASLDLKTGHVQLESTEFESTRHAAYSPDGKKILFIARVSSREPYALWIRSGKDGTLMRIADSENAACPSWSFDGTYISYSKNDRQYVLDLQSFETLEIAPELEYDICPAAWSPTENSIYLGASEELEEYAFIYRFDALDATYTRVSDTLGKVSDISFADNGETILFCELKRLSFGEYQPYILQLRTGSAIPDTVRRINSYNDFAMPQISPDGLWMTFVVGRSGFEYGDLYLVDLLTNEQWEIENVSRTITQTSWRPDSKAIAVTFDGALKIPYLYQVSVEGKSAVSVMGSYYMTDTFSWSPFESPVYKNSDYISFQGN